MKTHSRNALTVALMLLLIAPFSVRAQDSPDLEVSDPQFTYDVNSKITSDGAYSGRGPIPTATVTSSPVQKVSALFRNKGAKSIKSVTWEYIVFSDPKETKVQHIYRISSNQTILPGESARLGKEGYYLRYSEYRKARVTRIKYADGMIWQGTRTEK